MLAGRASQKEQLIEVLQDMQDQYGYLSEENLRLVAQRLQVPEIEVFQVASFYKAFSLEPRGRHVATVCTGTACHVRGSSRLVDTLCRELGIAPGETTPDGAITLRQVNCLGCCALGPVVVLDGVYHDHMNAAKARRLIAAVRGEDGKADEGHAQS